MDRVQKLLSNYGYCSRRAAEDLIAAGRVAVNGKVITLGDKASLNDKITVDGKKVGKKRKVYLMFNKPIHCVTALRDKQHKTVMDYIKVKERIFPVGRLDFYSAGLLLLTNDGDFANKVMHPSNEVRKTYLVRLDHPIKRQEIRALEKGVMLKDGKTAPAKIYSHSPQLVEVTIHEGRNRIIRRMFKKIGFRVSSLERVRIGRLGLGSLKRGRYRVLTRKDKELIFARR